MGHYKPGLDEGLKVKDVIAALQGATEAGLLDGWASVVRCRDCNRIISFQVLDCCEDYSGDPQCKCFDEEGILTALFGSGNFQMEYRGWKIERFKGVQVGHPRENSNSLRQRLGHGTSRKLAGYILTNPEDGYEKHTDTLRDAKEYIDNYFGSEK